MIELNCKHLLVLFTLCVSAIALVPMPSALRPVNQEKCHGMNLFQAPNGFSFERNQKEQQSVRSTINFASDLFQKTRNDRSKNRLSVTNQIKLCSIMESYMSFLINLHWQCSPISSWLSVVVYL